jgi:FdhD protein
MPHQRTAQVMVRRLPAGDLGPDRVIVEEPLEIRLDDNLVTTTMRTPGHDFELAAGLCLTEGLLGDPPAPVRRVRYCGTGPAVATEFNVVSVDSDGTAPVPVARLATTTSSCGLCGSVAVDQLRARLRPLGPATAFAGDVLLAVPERVRGQQELFDATGGVHAAAAFDRGGRPLVVREDVGRHNAVDKVVGRLLLDGALPARGLGLFVSGRASFEIVQKAWAAGFAAVLAVSAPSGLAVEAARAGGLALFGFARGDRMNLYTPARADT